MITSSGAFTKLDKENHHIRSIPQNDQLALKFIHIIPYILFEKWYRLNNHWFSKHATTTTPNLPKKKFNILRQNVKNKTKTKKF